MWEPVEWSHPKHSRKHVLREWREKIAALKRDQQAIKAKIEDLVKGIRALERSMVK
jgi:hypothetical protein